MRTGIPDLPVLNRGPGYKVQECVTDGEDSPPIPHACDRRGPLRTAVSGDTDIPNVPSRHLDTPLSLFTISSIRGNSSWRRETVPQFPPPVVGTHGSISSGTLVRSLTGFPSISPELPPGPAPTLLGKPLRQRGHSLSEDCWKGSRDTNMS